MPNQVNEDFIRIWNRIDRIQGWLNFEEARCLHSLTNQLPPDSCIIEIGCYRGRSTILLAESGRPVVTLDPLECGFNLGLNTHLISEEDEQELVRNISPYPNIQWCRTWAIYKNEIISSGKIGLVFIDGDHNNDQCYRDFQAILPYINPQTLIVFHDNGNFKEVTATIKFLVATNQLKPVQEVKSIFVGTYIGKPISND